MFPCGRQCAPCQGIFILQYTLDVLGLHWAQRSSIATLTSHILLLAQIQAQKHILLGPNIWSNYFMLLGPIPSP